MDSASLVSPALDERLCCALPTDPVGDRKFVDVCLDDDLVFLFGVAIFVVDLASKLSCALF
jgi:hypothetical protein